MNWFVTRSLTISFLMVISGTVVHPAHAMGIAEFVVTEQLHTGNAEGSYAEYKAERDSWRNKIAEDEAKLKACGDCAQREEIEKDLRYWKDTENKFQEIAGQAAVAVGMPPVVAKALGINMAMTPGPSAEERRRMHTVERPPWADDRPEFCRKAVDDYIGCLRAFKARLETVFTGNAKMAGGQCYDLLKLARHCGAENYEAFHAEVALQKRRAAGEIIPEYLPYDHELYYGDVPDDFMPTIPQEVVLEQLATNEKPHEVRFTMRKKGNGILSVAVVRPFNYSMIVPAVSSQPMDEESIELRRRIGDDFMTLTHHVEPTPLVLFCQYSKGDGIVPSYEEAYKFWYLPPPKEADPKRLLSRASNHRALVVAEPRTECPLTEQEAKRLHSQWQAKVAKLRAATPQISAREHLPKPQWLEEQNRQHAELYQLQERHKEATKAFPFEGVFTFETTLDGETTRGQCTLHPDLTDRTYYFLHCRYPRGEMTQVVKYPANGWFQVPWALNGKQARLHYFADTTEPNLLAGGEDPFALVGDDASISGRLVRTGDLTPLRAFPVEGVYRYERTADGITDSGRCEITTIKRYRPPQFHFHCNSHDGSAFSNTAQNRDPELYVSWPLKGTSMISLAFIVADNPVDALKQPQTLLGWSSGGGQARFVRIGDLEPEPEGISQAERSRRRRAADDAWRRAIEAKQDPLTAQGQQALDVPSGGVASPTVASAAPSRPANGRCTPEAIAGTYRTGLGPLKCEPASSDGLVCYWGRKRTVRLAFDEARENLSGTWCFPNNGANGRVVFPVSPQCELVSGLLGKAGQEPHSSWRVKGRQP